jgi:surfeit locus 1 family protein
MLNTIREKHLLWPGILALAGLAVLILLGNWQMRRLDWKEGLIGSIAERVDAPPVPLSVVESRAAEGGDPEYTRVTAEGQFLNDREMHLYALDHEQGPGWHIITPLRQSDGSTVLVNRGYVPHAMKDPRARRQGQIEGTTRVVGLVRVPEPQGMFVPGNDPEKNIWYWRDLDAMAAIADPENPAEVRRYIVDAQAVPANPGGWPKGGVTLLELPNRHLEYALTWYGLAGALVVVFFAFAANRWRQPTE